MLINFGTAKVMKISGICVVFIFRIHGYRMIFFFSPVREININRKQIFNLLYPQEGLISVGAPHRKWVT